MFFKTSYITENSMVQEQRVRQQINTLESQVTITLILNTNGLLSFKLISSYSNAGDDLVLMTSQCDSHPVCGRKADSNLPHTMRYIQLARQRHSTRILRTSKTP